MARRPRVCFPNATYHLMARGNRKAAIFQSDADQRDWLRVLADTVERYAVGCRAYCLMANHYHLILHTPEANVSAAMRHLNGVYTLRYNKRHSTTGHVYEGRFTSVLIDDTEHLRIAARYVLRNPVKAGLVEKVDSWPWSSYRATARLESAPRFLDVDWIRWAFGSSPEDAAVAFQAFVNVPPGESGQEDTSAVAIGPPSYLREVRDRLAAGARALADLPRAHRALGRPELAALFPASMLTRDATLLRYDAIGRAHVEHGYRLSEIARFLRLHPSTVGAALRRRGSGHEKRQSRFS